MFKAKKWPKYLFTDSGMVALSSLPLGICSFGLYGMLSPGLSGLPISAHLWLMGMALLPSLTVLFFLARMEKSQRLRRERLSCRQVLKSNYKHLKPINNGQGRLASVATPEPAKPDSRITLFPGVTIEAGENPFRPVTDQAIDETLVRLAQAQQKLRGRA